MLHEMKKLLGAKVKAMDGPFGKVEDVYFDDELWVIRYLVVSCGGFLNRKNVLISPISLSEAFFDRKELVLSLTKEQIEKSPDIDTHKPFSRQQEQQLYSYYNWPPYWGNPGPWALGPYGVPWGPYIGKSLTPTYSINPHEQEKLSDGLERPNEEETHMRSIKEVLGYHIRSRDETFGHVENFVFDDEVWMVRYLVIDLVNIFPSKHILVSPEWVKDISWAERKFYFDLTKKTMDEAPDYLGEKALDRSLEIRVHEYFAQAKYWEREHVPERKRA